MMVTIEVSGVGEGPALAAALRGIAALLEAGLEPGDAGDGKRPGARTHWEVRQPTLIEREAVPAPTLENALSGEWPLPPVDIKHEGV